MRSSTSNSEGRKPPAGLWREISRTPPRAFLYAALLIGLAELVVSRLPPDPETLLEHRYYPPDRVPSLDDSIVHWQVYHVLAGDDAQDILLMGDSSCLMGLRPLRVTDATGLQAWNFGTIGLYGALGHKKLLELYFERRGVPRIVVYHVAWDPLTSARWVKGTPALGRLTAWLKILSDEQVQPVPTMRYRNSLRRRLVPEEKRWKLENTPRGDHPSDKEVRRLLRERRGALTELVRKPPESDVLALDFDPEQKQALSELLALTETYDFDLVLALQPTATRFQSPKSALAAEQLGDELQSIADRFPRATLMKPLVRFYPDELCATETHLTEEGAQRNTDEVIEWLRSSDVLPQ